MTKQTKVQELEEQIEQLKAELENLQKQFSVENFLFQLRNIHYANSSPNNYKYAPIIPYASYSPWLTDIAFQKILTQLAGHSLLDIYRLWELWCLCSQLTHVQGDVLEVGVWRGGSAVLMAKRFESLGVALSVYAADTFFGIVKAGEQDPSYQGGEHNETSPEIVKNLASNVGVSCLQLLQGIFPEETGQKVAGCRFRLVHIDVDVYQSAKDTLEWAWPRLNSGGVVVFDDFGFSSCQGITQLIEEYGVCEDRLVIYNLNGHALMIKR